MIIPFDIRLKCTKDVQKMSAERIIYVQYASCVQENKGFVKLVVSEQFVLIT